jgi:sorbitol-specific phosphotransferase system component IIBC
LVFLYILLGVLALLLFILVIPIELLAYYNETLTLRLKVLFVKITLLSPDKKKKEKPKKKEEKPKEKKPQEKKPEKKKKKKEKKPNILTKIKDKKGVTGLLSLFSSLARIAVGALRGIFSHIVFKKLIVGITLSGEDASEVAVNYGRVCSVLYPAVNVITAATVCKDYHVTVEPIFDPDQPTAAFADVHLYLRLIWVVWEAIKAGVKLLIVRIKL